MRSVPLIIFASAIVLLGAGCHKQTSSPLSSIQQPRAISASDQALRTELENVWKGIQKSLNNPNGKGYGSFLDLTFYPELAFLKDDSLSQTTIQEIKSTVFYDLSRTTFVGVRREEDWAGYFFLRNPEDVDGFHRKSATGTVTLVLYSFHQVDNTWKMVPDTMDTTIQLTMDKETDEKAIQEKFITAQIIPSRANKKPSQPLKHP